jgi:hypothetical protein
MMENLGPYLIVVAFPLGLWALFAVFRWRYLRLVRRTIYGAAPVLVAQPEGSSERRNARPIALNWIEAGSATHTTGPAKLRAALRETRRMRVLLAVSGGVYVLSAAVVVWYVLRLRGHPNAAATSLAYFSTASGVFIILAFSGRTLTAWAVATLGWLAAAVALLMGPLGVPWSRALRAIFSGLDYGTTPIPCMALLVPRTIRPLLVGFVPLIGFWTVLTVALLFVLGRFGVTVGDVHTARASVWAIGAIAGLLGVGITIWQIRRGVRLWYVVVLCACGGASMVAFPFGRPLAFAFIGGIGANGLVTLLVWLLFSGFLRLKARGLLPDEMLHFVFCWLVLTAFVPILAQVGWDTIGWPLLPLALCIAALALTTLSYRTRTSGAEPPRMLLLRVFGREPLRNRLLDLLDDSWRRVGRIDLVVGADLAVRTVSAMALEGFLLGRVDRQFLDSIPEADERLAELPERRALDGRYPLNELHCSADVWQHVVASLALEADVVLMDLRGFQATNTGASFELSLVMERVRLERVVLLSDEHTDESMLTDTIQRTWQQLSANSGNAGVAVASVDVLRCTGRRALVEKAIANCVFRAAERALEPAAPAAPAS